MESAGWLAISRARVLALSAVTVSQAVRGDGVGSSLEQRFAC